MIRSIPKTRVECYRLIINETQVVVDFGTTIVFPSKAKIEDLTTLHPGWSTLQITCHHGELISAHHFVREIR